ncbi:MAG: GumC family protein, partial [Candidatus Methylomirabilis sp.]
MDDQSERRVDYYRLLKRVAVKRWRLILLVFVGLAIPMTIYAVVWVPNTYEAVATIFFEDEKKQRGPNLLREWLPTSDSSFQLALLSSHSLAQAVIDRLSPQARDELLGGGMSKDYVGEAGNFIRWILSRELVFVAPHLRILRELEARMKFDQLKSGEVQIRAAAYQPPVATELANTYVRVLQARGGSFAREEGRAAREFIESSLKQTKKDLEEAEAALAQFEREKGVVNLPQRSQLEAAKLAQLENALADGQASKEIAKARLSALRGGKDVTGASASSAAGRARQQVRDRLRELEEKLATLLEKYTEQHPLVVSTLAEIDQARANLGATLQGAQDSSASTRVRLRPAERAALAKEMVDLEVEISALEAKEEVLKRRMAVLTRNLTTASQGELEGLTLLRRVDGKRSLFNLLTERLSQARIQEQADAPGLRVIDYASLPMTPNTMPVRIRVLLGLLLGLGLGIVIA